MIKSPEPDSTEEVRAALGEGLVLFMRGCRRLSCSDCVQQSVSAAKVRSVLAP